MPFQSKINEILEECKGERVTLYFAHGLATCGQLLEVDEETVTLLYKLPANSSPFGEGLDPHKTIEVISTLKKEDIFRVDYLRIEEPEK